MDNLKPCPFCGGKAVIFTHSWDNAYDTYSAECEMCGAETLNKPTEEAAVAAWNRRAKDGDK